MTGQNETIEGILFLQGRSLIGKSVYDFVGFFFYSQNNAFVYCTVKFDTLVICKFG
jgi:hypothetical protein